MKNIDYKVNDSISVGMLTELYSSVGWSAYAGDAEIMGKILPGSFCYISAWSGEKLVGLVRAISDGCYVFYIQDILISHDYQRQGIGTQLIKQILEQAKNMKQIILTTDNTKKTIDFYKSVGFLPMQETGAISFIK